MDQGLKNLNYEIKRRRWLSKPQVNVYWHELQEIYNGPNLPKKHALHKKRLWCADDPLPPFENNPKGIHSTTQCILTWSAKNIIDKEGYFNWFKDWTLPPPHTHTKTPHWLGCKESRSYLGVIKLTIFIKTIFCSLLLIVHLCRIYTKVYFKLFSFSLLTNLLPPPFFY